MKSEQQVRQLREALERAERSGAGRPYPEPLRRAANDYRREREREGASLRQVAAELGVSEASLARWARGREEPVGQFRAIEVVAEPVRPVSAVVVHGPRGLRIEGLSLQELAALIERLS
jgi:transposase